MKSLPPYLLTLLALGSIIATACTDSDKSDADTGAKETESDDDTCVDSFVPDGDALGVVHGDDEGGAVIGAALISGDLYLEIASWVDYGGPTSPGEYPITEDESSLSTCGLCIDVINGQDPEVHMMPVADQGRVFFEKVPEPFGPGGMGEFAGRFEGVKLRRLDSGAEEGDCLLSLDGVTWHYIFQGDE